MSHQTIFVGIDVAKDTLDICINPSEESFSIPYTEADISALIKRLKKLDATLIVIEATGGYEMALVAALAAKALPVTVVNPRQVRDFAKATRDIRQDRSYRGSDSRSVRRSSCRPLA